LWTYVPGRHRTHGDFEQRAQQHSTQVWLDFNPNWIAAGAVALGVLAGIAGSRKLRKKARSILRAA
jgi:hypothetical protein